MDKYKCRVLVNRKTNEPLEMAGHSKPNALAAWDMLNVDCNNLDVDFQAAKCRNSKCNLESFSINKPADVIVKSKPIFSSEHFSGMKSEHETVLVPKGCYCNVE